MGEDIELRVTALAMATEQIGPGQPDAAYSERADRLLQYILRAPAALPPASAGAGSPEGREDAA